MKTSLSMNLAYHLAKRRHKVLLVDMDPQASLTDFMGIEPADLKETVANAILEETPLSIHRDLHGIDLVPANIILSAAEMQLVSAMAREWRLKRALETVAEKYDFILIDSPPSLGILSVLSLVAATYVLVPIQTQYKCFKGTELLLDSIKQVRKLVNQDLGIAGIVPTMYDGRNSQDKDILEAIETQMKDIATIYPPIPRATAFADASMAHMPLALYNPKHPVLKVLKKIAAGLEKMS